MRNRLLTIITRIFRLPSQDNFPIFKDPDDKQMHDPRLFFRKLDRALGLHMVPRILWERVLVSCVQQDLDQQYVEESFVDKMMEWKDVQQLFTDYFIDPALEHDLDVELQDCTQDMKERVHEYTERFQSLLTRLNYKPNEPLIIVMCERGLIPRIRDELQKVKAQKTLLTGIKFKFKTLQQLYEAAATIELGLTTMHGRKHRASTKSNSGHKDRKRFEKKPRVNNIQAATSSSLSTTSSSTAAGKVVPQVNKLEVNIDGVPVNVNKKKSKSKRTRHVHRASEDIQSNDRGGYSFNHRGRTSHFRGRVRENTNNNNINNNTNNSKYAPFNGKCFVCGMVGHRQVNCPSRNEVNHFKVENDNIPTINTVAPQFLRRQMFITSSLIPGIHASLNDTGAQLSGISLSLVKKNRIFVHKPRTGEPKYLRMVDKGITVPRIGYVNIPITVEFKGGAERIPYRCTKQFEVLNMDYPFILGVDILPSIFPNDDIMNYLLLPSRITTPPVPHIGSVVCDINNESTRTSISDFNEKPTIDFDYNQ